MNWDGFKHAAPELAALGETRFEAQGVVLLGTLRANGFPRISPVETLFCDGELEIGMMWRSSKALDLLRDPRCVVHSTVTDRRGVEGDFKVYGRAVALADLDARRRYCEALFAKIGWRPTEPEFHVFRIDLESAGYIQFGDVDPDKQIRLRWSAAASP
jgi:hypothetical protein